MNEDPAALCGATCPDVVLTDARTGELSKLSDIMKDRKEGCVLEWYGHHCGPCAASAPQFEELAKKYQGKIKVCMINIVGGGQGEAKFAETAGLATCGRYVCLEPDPRFCVRGIPHVTVIHRGGMVVRNGTAPDLATLLEAMANEPVED